MHSKKMFAAQHNPRAKELVELIEKECDLGKLAKLLAELRNLMDEQTKPSSTIMERSHGRGHTAGKLARNGRSSSRR